MMSRICGKIMVVFFCSIVIGGLFCGCTGEETKSSEQETTSVITESKTQEEEVSLEEDIQQADSEWQADSECQVDPETLEYIKWMEHENKKKGNYTFQKYVSSTIMNEIIGPEIYDTYCKFIDAVLAGETSFVCPDEDTYNWVMGQYAYRLFPVVDVYVDYPEDGETFVDGVGYFRLLIPYEDFLVKEKEFEDLVVGILNDAFEDDYSDLEKVLGLYIYFVEHDCYDYDIAFQEDWSGADKTINAYRFLTERKGICQEISIAYSYLLLQAGVDATVMHGKRDEDGYMHQWSYITMNGRNYHIDPTYAISSGGLNMSYFLMSDEQRANEGYSPENWTIGGYYSEAFEHPDYTADDDTYSFLWGNMLWGMNTETKQIAYYDKDNQNHVYRYGTE